MEDVWIFPEKLKAFKPKVGSKMKKIFDDEIALILFSQYKRNHIIDLETLEFLKWFSIETANKIRNFRKENNDKELTLEQVVSIWIECWKNSPTLSPHAMKAAYSWKKWEEVIGPILVYINEEKKLELVKENRDYYLISK